MNGEHENLTKSQVLTWFDGNVTRLADAIGMSRQGWYKWPEQLEQHMVDRVVGACLRVGVLPRK